MTSRDLILNAIRRLELLKNEMSGEYTLGIDISIEELCEIVEGLE